MKTKLLLFCTMFMLSAFVVNAQPGVADMIHNWTFEGGNANDLVGTANGDLVGGAAITGGDLVISTAGQWVELPGSTIGINQYDALTFNIWFNPAEFADSNNSFHMVWYFGGSELDGGTGTVEFGSNGIFLSPARGDNVCRSAISTGNIATPWSSENGVNYAPELAGGVQKDTTYNVVTTINSDYIAMYINGVLIDTANLTDMSGAGKNSIANLKNDFAWIGRGGYAGDQNYLSTVHDFKIYKAVLSESDIATIYTNGPDYVGINEVANQFSPKVYNSNGIIYISNLNNADVTSVKLYSILGNMVYQSSEFNGQINHNLSTGVYFVSIESNKGTSITKLTVK